jgi:hypothetical protein
VNRLIGIQHKRRARICIGIDRDGLDAHAAGGFDNPASNFATVGYEDFFEHFIFSVSQGGNLPRPPIRLQLFARSGLRVQTAFLRYNPQYSCSYNLQAKVPHIQMSATSPPSRPRHCEEPKF